MSATGLDSPSRLLLASYEALPYEGKAITVTHPDVLATAARLRGLSPPNVERCRVLDLGCSTGGNIVAMALTIPNGTFVGVDLSPRQIDAARSTAATLGLRNVRFEAMSIADIGDDFGVFDYIVSHGVFSWVPPDVQSALLRVCARNLAPNGIAYVSYNTYPGWHLRDLVREMLVFHDRPALDAEQRVARGRELVEFMARSVLDKNGVYRSVLEEELHTLRASSDTYFLHEELEPVNRPMYFTEFVQHAAAAGLRYLSEASLSAFEARLESETRERIRGWSADRIAYEQYLDYLRNRTFRRSLLCRAETTFSETLMADAIESMYLSIRSKPDPAAPAAKEPGVEVFSTGDGISVTMNHAVVLGALHALLDARPALLSFAQLLEETRARVARAGGDGPTKELLADAMLRCASIRLVDVHVRAAPGATALSVRPVASPLAILQAHHAQLVSTLRHHNIELAPFDRFVLAHTDGTLDAPAMTDLVMSAFARGELIEEEGAVTTRERVAEGVRRAWRGFLEVSLLVA